RRGDSAAGTGHDEQRVAQLVAALLLDPRPRLLEVLRHLAQLAQQSLIGADSADGGGEADAASRTAARDRAVAECGKQLFAEFLIPGKLNGQLYLARCVVLQRLR